jgi:hypothetical protein
VTDPAERFIEAAVRPLADNAELQMMAAQELRAAIENAPEGALGDSLEQAAANLESARPRNNWKIILYAAAALAAILVAIPVARDCIRLRVGPWAFLWPGQRLVELLGPLTASERLLLFGDHSQPKRAAALERLWESDRENPALFAIYARACAAERKLPADFLKTSDRIDPQNAWFRYLAAGVTGYKSVEETRVPYRIRKVNPDAPRFRILKPAEYAEALQLFTEATRLPKADSYKKDLLLRRIEILPPGDDASSRELTRAYLESAEPFVVWTGRELSPVISARAEELAAAGDKQGFIELAASWEIFTRRWVENDDLIASSLNSLPDLTRAARTLGLESHAARYTRLELAIQKRWIHQQQRTLLLTKQWKDVDWIGGGILAAGTKVEHSPTVEPIDLLPHTMATREMLRRFASAAAAVVVMVALLLGASGRFMRGRQVQSLSATLLKVLRPSDYLWIILGGVVIPLLVHVLGEWIVSAASSLSTKYAAEETSLRFGALVAAMLAFPALLAAKQLGVRLGGLGWPGPPAFGLRACFFMTVFAFVSGCTRSETAQVLGWAFVVIPVGIVFISLTLNILLVPRADIVRALTWGRALLPAYATALLLLALLVPFHHAREKYWTARNVLTKIEPGIPAMNRYEYEVENQVRKDLLELLDSKP